MSVTRFGNSNWYQGPNFRRPPLPYGNLVPNVTHSSSERPHSDAAVAAWLPLADTTDNRAMGFFVRQEEPSKDYLVLTPGKVVSFSRENLGMVVDDGPLGRLVPAGVRIAWAAAGAGDTVLEYNATDVAQFTQDLTTGVAVAAAASYTKAQVEAALLGRGLLRPSEALEDFISSPVGVIPQSAYAWAGGDGLQPAGYNFHNYKRQHKSQLLCDWVLRFPFAPAGTATARDIPAIGTVVAADTEVETPAVAGDAAWVTGAGGELASVLGLEGAGTRYGSVTNTDYVGLVLGALRIEVVPHLPFSITRAAVDITSTILQNRKCSIEDLIYDGDYYVDTELGIVFMYEAGGNALPTGMAAADIINVQQHSAHTDYISDLAMIVGDVRPGDLLVCDSKSNLRPFVPRPAETQASTAGSTDYVDPATYDRPEDVIAQVLTFSRYPREDMSKVKTFYENLPTGLVDQMPGSATDGYTDNQTYAGGGQFEVIINFLK